MMKSKPQTTLSSATRRTFVKSSLAITLGTSAGISVLAACTSNTKTAAEKATEGAVEAVKAFTQTPLDFAYEALEPSIDAMTMEIHYTKHHAGYTKKLNDAIAEDKISVGSIEDLMAKISTFATNVRNNSGGYYNHELFWKNLKPGGGEPDNELKKAIEQSFGSYNSFKEQFSAAAKTRFGSGWAWLVADGEGKLSIGSTPNQDNPLMDISEFKGAPLLALDVWEHAYYLHYQNRRADYIQAFWDVVNWEEVGKRYKAL